MLPELGVCAVGQSLILFLDQVIFLKDAQLWSCLAWLVDWWSICSLLGNTVVIIFFLLVLRSDRSTSVTIVDGISFSPTGSGAGLVFGLLVCSQNSSNDTSVIGGDRSCLGLFSFIACGVVVYDTVTRGSRCSVSTKVFGSHPI
jgi:hypothetical protein